MIIFINNKITKFCRITLRIIKIYIHKRKVVPFVCLMVYISCYIFLTHRLTGHPLCTGNEIVEYYNK